MFLAEEELPIQIAEVNCVEVNDLNFSKAGKNKILEQLASDSSCADEQYARLFSLS